MVALTIAGTQTEQESSTSIDTEAPAKHTYSSESLVLGYSLIFVVSWIYAANCVLNRSLKSVHHAVVMFWHGTLGITIAVIGVCIDHFFGRSESS